MVRHFLRDTSLSIRKAATMAEAVAACTGADVLVSEHALGDGDSAALLAALRNSGNAIPMIVAAAAADPQRRATILRTRADGFLAKPLKQETLLTALAEFLVLGREDELSADIEPPSPEVLDQALRDLRRHTDSLTNAERCGDAAAARETCRHIASSASAAGMAGIARAARALADRPGRPSPGSLGRLRAEIEAALSNKAA